jgi:hypothetical protein
VVVADPCLVSLQLSSTWFLLFSTKQLSPNPQQQRTTLFVGNPAKKNHEDNDNDKNDNITIGDNKKLDRQESPRKGKQVRQEPCQEDDDERARRAGHDDGCCWSYRYRYDY